MNLRTLILIGLALGLSACSKQEPVTPEPADEMADEAAAEMASDWRDEALIEHMHRHADYVDDLNSALEMGDLAAARTPAYWLSQHDTVDGLPPELQPYADGMRAAAAEVGRGAAANRFDRFDRRRPIRPPAPGRRRPSRRIRKSRRGSARLDR